ncbi:Endonuclease, Uma2 family (restriction endonuclease fold) [Amycolatopsis pretoriensis]|uniref:Endonuclease, Uma2 family (Restriction endonuclease fold) n=1 Tax=Amycolatopsis pretoriensis TaxID=218821 RepID=A0A1H5QK80_9PSEU|nr:Uma2 family endonuclease [Amycolatopsis pretoriensis]SEF26459.1 Endonuclease, Uma2 family (restriction endonuclease fold) [Amycolatopsis pretoriensis]
MTALPDWMVLPPEGLTVDGYEALPEEVCRAIEIVDGAIVVNPAPRRPHQKIIRRMSYALEEACGVELAVEFDVDLRLRDVPLLNRRPDLVVYDATLNADTVLRPEHCALVIEVMSPGSITADQTDKPAEYAGAGIPHFWRVENETDDVRGLTVFCYRLDPTTGVYTSSGAHKGKLAVSDPFDFAVDLADLL